MMAKTEREQKEGTEREQNFKRKRRGRHTRDGGEDRDVRERKMMTMQESGRLKMRIK